MRNPIPLLRKIAILEGVSFLVLLGVAMPLKYFAGLPLAVKIVGWLHGLLFMAFVLALLRTMVRARWRMRRGAAVFIAGLLPFGPFVMDRRMCAYEAEFSQRSIPDISPDNL